MVKKPFHSENNHFEKKKFQKFWLSEFKKNIHRNDIKNQILKYIWNEQNAPK